MNWTKISKSLGLFTMLALAACASPSVKFPAAEWAPVASPKAAGYSPEKIAALDELISSFNTQSLIAISGGSVLYSYGRRE